MRFLVRFAGVARMHGVDATEAIVKRGQGPVQERRTVRPDQVHVWPMCATAACRADVRILSGARMPGATLSIRISSSPRRRDIVKPGGTIAFTDWVEADGKLSDGEAQRFLRFMKFPNIQSLGGYRDLLKKSGCDVAVAQDTGRFALCVDLYLTMLNNQLTYDALKIIGFDRT